MERESNDLVDLGTVSGDTAGDRGLPIEPNGRMPVPGIGLD